MRSARSSVARYSLALLATVLALALRRAFTPLLGNTVPYFTVWSAVAFSAWYCGLGPSIFTAISSALGVWFFFLPPYHSFAIQSPAELSGIVGFLILSGFIVALGEANRRAQSTRFHQAHLLDLANDAIIELDIADDTIKYWNQGAEKLYGWSKSEALGKHIHTLLKTTFPVSLEQSKATLQQRGYWAGEAIHTRRDGTQIQVATRWTLRRSEEESTTWLEINRDISDRKKAEQELQKAYGELENRVKERTAELEESNQTLGLLSGRLMRAQDEERRRIARELHDSAGQYLAAVGMALEAVKSEAKDLSAPLTQKLEQASEVTMACTNEIRTMSHLLHPPLLEELGLASAIRIYVEGFAARSGVQVLVEMPEELGRLGNDIEIVLFRVLQESLTNIHRHSGSKTATVQVGADSHHSSIEIQDEGKGKGDGNSASFRPGIGIMGMRERVKYLGGVLEITSNHNGTRVKAVIPLASEGMRAGSVE
jgi:PAS domain S-box-containing protein